jgi:hypothetical protein
MFLPQNEIFSALRAVARRVLTGMRPGASARVWGNQPPEPCPTVGAGDISGWHTVAGCLAIASEESL